MAVRNMTRCAVFAALMALCAWIALPVGQLSFSLQSLAVALALGVLGGRRGTVAVGVYLALGALGAPFFTGFQGGVGILLGPTGGFLWGFLGAGLVFWLLEKRLPLWLNLLLVNFVCYLCGAVWYAVAFGGDFWTVLMVCVVPYLLPDGCKYALALLLIPRLKKDV